MGKVDEKRKIDQLRNFGGKEKDGTDIKRGLATSIPKPNILRIELLDGKARERYLGGIERKGDRNVKQKSYASVIKKTNDTFYGFVKYTGSQSYGISSEWEKSTIGGGVYGSLKKTVSDIAASTKSGSLAGGIGKHIDNISEVAKDLTGVNAKFTGSGSMKRYTGSHLSNGFAITCGWYLPEQFLLCIKSLRILHKMVYPIKVEEDNLGEALNDLFAGDNTFLKIAKGTLDAAASALQTGENFFNPGDKSKEDAAKEGPAYFVKKLSDLNRFFGREMSFDPLPVRVSLGQYMDIEPLVITNIKFDFSNENFINKEGRHVPVTCTVEIQFKYWLNPAPDLHFVSIMGHEMFGTTDESEDANKKLVNTYKTADE